jgi:hypothetical protein
MLPSFTGFIPSLFVVIFKVPTLLYGLGVNDAVIVSGVQCTWMILWAGVEFRVGVVPADAATVLGAGAELNDIL